MAVYAFDVDETLVRVPEILTAPFPEINHGASPTCDERKPATQYTRRDRPAPRKVGA